MSTSTLVYEKTQSSATRLADYAELTKPRIAVMELIVVAAAAGIASHTPPAVATFAWLLLGTTLVAGSASILNQWLERTIDGRMPRTANRPLPAGRLSPREAFWLGTTALLLGAGCLALMVNLATAAFGVATWILYVCIYTPLKTRSAWNTAVGAVAGAMPVLMGGAAVGGLGSPAIWGLFLILFFWQFPHFMAIAWLYRRDYAAGGLRMLPAVDGCGRRAALAAVCGAAALVIVSLAPTQAGIVPLLCRTAVAALGVAYLGCAIHFARCLDDRAARRLLRASLVYLPLTLCFLLLAFFVQTHATTSLIQLP